MSPLDHKPYLQEWANRDNATHMLSAAIDRYVAINIGRSPKGPARDFALDAEADAVDQLIRFYNQLLSEAPESARILVASAQDIYAAARNTTPPSYFRAAIAGTFTLIVARADERPDIHYFLKTFRPLAKSERSFEGQLYFSAILRVADLMPQLPARDMALTRNALRREWLFQIENHIANASLARILARFDIEKWPFYIETICTANWPDDCREIPDKSAFVRPLQNMMLSVDPEAFAASFWRLGDYLHRNQARADVTGEALFGSYSRQANGDAVEDPGVRAPYKLQAPYGMRPSGNLMDYAVVARAEGNLGEPFRISPGDLAQDRQGKFALQALRKLVISYAAAVGVFAALAAA